MLSKKIIQITFVVLLISILFSIISIVLNYSVKELPIYVPKAQLLISALTSALVYYIWFNYFEFIKHEAAKKSTLIVGICIVGMALFKTFNLYNNRMIVVIIGVFFTVSYIFWIVTILRHKHNSKAYVHTRNYIFTSLTLIVTQLAIQIYLTITEIEGFAKERILITSLLNQIPWIFYFLFLKEIPNEKGPSETNTTYTQEEENIIDSYLKE